MSRIEQPKYLSVGHAAASQLRRHQIPIKEDHSHSVKITDRFALKRFAYIDALRGYAILGVLLVHTSQYSGFDTQAAFGARGVQLFFVVSALTLMFSWHARDDGAAAFFIRRIFRIAPMFWLSIPIYLGLDSYAYTGQVLGAAFFLQASRPDWIVAPIVPGGWSVCAEIAFYCLFPLVANHINSFLKASALAIACLAAARFWSTIGQPFGEMIFPAFSAPEIATWAFLLLPSQLPAFAIGVLCYFVVPEWKHHVGRTGTEATLACTLIWIAYLAAYRSTDISDFSLAFGLVAACLANGAGKYLINTAVILAGRFSFSMYLLQWPCIGKAVSFAEFLQVSGATRFFIIFTTTVAMATLLSAVTYYFAERPMIWFGNRVTRLVIEPQPRARSFPA